MKPIRNAALLAAITVTASAQIKTWDGGGDANWLTGANWDGDEPPIPGDSLVFQGFVGLSNSNNFPAGTMFTGLEFAAGAGPFMLSGNGITLAGDIANNSANTQSVGLGLTLGSGTFNVSGSTTGGAVLALGAVTAPTASGGAAIFTPNAGAITTTATNTHGILGGWATVGNTTGGVNWATVNGSNEIVAHTSYTDVAGGGTIASDPSANIRMLGAANLGGASADINTLKSSATGGTGGNDVTNIGAGNTLRFGTMGGILNDTGAGNNMRIGGNSGNTGIGSITAGGNTIDTPGTLVLNASATASTHANVIGILSTITDNGTGAVTIVKTGLASAFFQSANSYSGGTFINEGHIQGNAGTSFGTGDIHVAPGGQAFLNSTAIFANDIHISGTGLSADNTGAIRFSNATTTGVITLEGDARVNINGNTTASANGRITGSHAFEFFANGGNNTTPVLVLGNTANDWTGGTSVTAGPNNANVVNATLRLGAGEVIPHGVNAGDVTLASTGSSTNARARIDLNGFSETINGLNSATDARFEIVNLAASNTATLTLGANDADGSFGGRIIDSGSANAISLVKTGGGTQILGGANSYAGVTTVSAGTLLVNGSLGDSAVTVDGGTFGGSGTVGGAVTFGSGALAPGSSAGISPATLTINNSLVLSANTTLAWDINAADTTVGLGINDLVDGLTDLTLDGTLDISGIGDFSVLAAGAEWRLFNYSGSLTDDSLVIGSAPTLDDGLTWSIDTSTPFQVNLVLIPEPSSVWYGALGLLALVRRRR